MKIRFGCLQSAASQQKNSGQGGKIEYGET
jgi:hypothetical protein